MFKVVNGVKSLGEYFMDGVVEAVSEIATLKLQGPKLVSMLEDSLLGFAGAGAAAYQGPGKDPEGGPVPAGLQPPVPGRPRRAAALLQKEPAGLHFQEGKPADVRGG